MSSKLFLKTFISSIFFVSVGSHANQIVPVVSVEPIIQNQVVSARQPVCDVVQVEQPIFNQNDSIISGIIGGVIGNEIFRDGNRSVGTGLGVLIGSQIGGTNSGQTVTSYRQQCAERSTNNLVPAVMGYNVTYILNGVRYTTVMSYNPGTHVTVYTTHTVR